MAYKFQVRRDTKANWLAENPVLEEGEPALEKPDASSPYTAYKIGDGTTAYADLDYGYNGSVLQELGDSTTAPVSQKVVTDEFNKINSVLGRYFEINSSATTFDISFPFKAGNNISLNLQNDAPYPLFRVFIYPNGKAKEEVSFDGLTYNFVLSESTSKIRVANQRVQYPTFTGELLINGVIEDVSSLKDSVDQLKSDVKNTMTVVDGETLTGNTTTQILDLFYVNKIGDKIQIDITVDSTDNTWKIFGKKEGVATELALFTGKRIALELQAIYDTIRIARQFTAVAYSAKMHVFGITDTLDQREYLTELLPKCIVAIGSSSTFGHNPKSYPEFLAEKLDGYSVLNYGAPGDSDIQTLSRIGAEPLFIASDIVIPASGGVSVSLKQSDGLLREVKTAYFLNGVNPCTIADIEGTLSSSGNTYIFTRSENGEAVNVRAGTLLIPNALKDNHAIVVAALAGNEGQGTEEGFAEKIINHYLKAESWSTSRRIIYMNQISRTNRDVESKFFARFGLKFFCVRQELINYGFEKLGIAPTEDDKQAIIAGLTPPSLLEDDGVHMKDELQEVVADRMIVRFRALKYID